MNTAKHDIFIGLKHDYCNLVEEINLWWWQRIKIKWWGRQRRVVFWEEFFQVGEWATPQLVLETFENLFLILTWKLVNRATTQIKKPSNWVTDNPTEYNFSIRFSGLWCQMHFVTWQVPVFFDHLSYILLGVSGYG